MADNLGTVRTLLDSEGNRIRDLVFAAWGEITQDTNPSLDFPFAITGREYDRETGLYFYRARYYDPSIGRFISEDPLGFAAGDTNLSRYVGNATTVATDPTGLHSIEIKGLKVMFVPSDTLKLSKIFIGTRIPGTSWVALTPQYGGGFITLVELEWLSRIRASSDALYRLRRSGGGLVQGFHQDVRYTWVYVLWVARHQRLPATYLFEYNCKWGTRVKLKDSGVAESHGKKFGPLVFVHILIGEEKFRALYRAASTSEEGRMHILGPYANEAFHVWFFTFGGSADATAWLRELMEAEEQWTKEHRMHMAEEAMSEAIDEVIGRGVRSPLPPTYEELLTGDSLKPMHNEEGQRFEGDRSAEEPMSRTLYLAALWIAYMGPDDPATHYDGLTTEQALERWFEEFRLGIQVQMYWDSLWSAVRQAKEALEQMMREECGRP